MIGLRSSNAALLCCRVLISIEQARKNYTAMAQHIIQGLNIMRECRARPYLAAINRLMPADRDCVPFLDIFITKLFAAPCGFANDEAKLEGGENTLFASFSLSHQEPSKSWQHRSIAPDTRMELAKIATSTLKFLDRVSQLTSAELAFPLLSERASLLDCLDSWVCNLDLVWMDSGRPEPIRISFLRFFHQILRIVLLGALDRREDNYVKLQIESDRLQSIADHAGVRVKGYVTCAGNGAV